MLVEDDNNLRQIYEDRLAAEGYEIVSAKDGEEALALAVKERPDLIIADIMMPRVSGFDMLDILRSTPETKDAKIVMMTALSQAEDKTRAEKLGADKYLVKSQVTLEDVVDVAAEMLGDQQAGANLASTGAVTVDPPTQQQPSTHTVTANVPVSAPTPDLNANPIPAPAPATEDPAQQQPSQGTTSQPEPSQDQAPKEPVAPEETGSPKPAGISIPVTSANDTSTQTSGDNQDDNNPAPKPSETKQSNEKVMTDQIDEFIASNPTLSTSAESDSKNKAATPTDTKVDVATPEPIGVSTSKVAAPETPTAESTLSAPTVQPQNQEPMTTPQTTEAKPPNVTEQSKDAMAAVDGLLNETVSSSPTSPDSKTGSDNKYVDAKSSSNEGESQSMIHTKRIEPISDAANKTPDINELLAKESEHSDPTPPAVNSVITPGGGSISPLPGSNVQDAIQGGAKDNSSDANPDNISL